MAKSGLSVDQTKGTFQARGIVTGVSKQSFYVEKPTTTNKPRRVIKFGLKVSPESTLFFEVAGMPKDKVYFGTTNKDKDGNSLAPIAVDWSKRNTFSQEGYRLIGMNIGLAKTTDAKGNEVNDKQYLEAFDGCNYLREHLKDGMSVFIKGNIEYSHFAGQNGDVVKNVKLVPNQISLCQKIDPSFGPSEDGKPYEMVADFTQPLVFMGIEPDEEKENEYILYGKIVNWNTIEDATFVLHNGKLAKNIAKAFNPYTKIDTWGQLMTIRNVDQVDDDGEDEGWGDKNKMNRQTSPYRMVRLITGADKDSYDVENYTEEKINAALEEIKKAEKKEGEFSKAPKDDDGWGKKGSKNEDDDEDDDIPWAKKK